MRYLLYTETFPHRRPQAERQTGIGRYCADLAHGLASLGHEVLVLTNDQIGTEAPSAREPYRVEVLGAPPQTRRERWRRRRQADDRVRALAPDYVLVGDPLANSVMAGLNRRPPRPLCPILHGTELATWRRMSRAGLRSPRQALASLKLRRYLRSAHALVCNSRYTAALLRELLPGASRVCIVYPCVSEPVIQRSAHPSSREALRQRLGAGAGAEILLVTVARISDRKNQLAVVDAMGRLTRDGAPFHYAIVGNTDAGEHDAYLRRVLASIEAQGLSARVTLLGGASDEEKVAYLDACDIFIMLSRTVGDSVEGFGISAIEASCRAKPVVVSDQGGMPETVLDGRTGVVVPPDDVGRLAEVLRRLGRDETMRREMGEAGRRFVLENFTPGIVARRLHENLTRTEWA